MSKKRVVHYINQFFAGIGGEEKACMAPEIREGPVGPGMAFNASFKQEAEIVATVICGDSYFNENLEKAKNDIIGMIEKYKPDIFIAGPAFNAGRYGVACGTVTEAVQKKFDIPAVTGMYIENPGVDLFKKNIFIVQTGNSAGSMREAVTYMTKLIFKMLNNESLGAPEEDHYIPRGIRKNYFAEERGSKRALEMLLKKIKEQDYTTEYPMPDYDRVKSSPAVKDLSSATIALVTSGGIVPKGNPDKIESSSASKFGKYDISLIDNLTHTGFQTAHGGYDPKYINEDPDRVLPVDALRELEQKGIIGKLHGFYYSTVGNGTSVSLSKKFAGEIAEELVRDEINGVILTST
jgi:glycine reductase complex component B subunit gamma